ncbi:MAG TPA: potassium transporter TrkG [Gammaproteobacteria bacterium]|nr:potassium transporter TrkG [Gammaproteobacteria bacterium]
MRFSIVLRTLGLLLLAFAATLVPPMAVSLLYGDGELPHFALACVVGAAAGLALWLPLRQRAIALRSRDGFVIVALVWAVMGLLGAVPFMLTLGLDFPAAFFESVAGYTTTGSTTLVGIDALPPSILIYRQQIQWLGGLGVIVLAVALLPMLGIGGMQLYKGETPGPFKDQQIAPRVTRSARSLCYVYVVLTLACAACFWFSGMSLFDAVAHSFSTISTGGSSTHDASIGYFHSVPVELVTIVFSLIGGISFNEHFLALRSLQFQRYQRDTQTRVFLALVVALALVTTAVLYLEGTYPSLPAALRHGLFASVASVSSTGFAIADFATWPLALPALMIFSMFVGGCAGSSAGGMKVIRYVVLFKQVGVHIHRLIHPQAIRRMKLDGQPVPDSVVEAVGGFFAVYVVVFVIFMVLAMMDGMDQVSAFGAVATSINNAGPGLGSVAMTFASVSPHGKIMFAIAMLLGRLEIFTFLVLLTPAFWKR